MRVPMRSIGGTDRSSNETSVIEVERRELYYPVFKFGQPKMGGNKWRKQSRLI